MVSAQGQMENQEGKGWEWRRDGEGYLSAPPTSPFSFFQPLLFLPPGPPFTSPSRALCP